MKILFSADELKKAGFEPVDDSDPVGRSYMFYRERGMNISAVRCTEDDMYGLHTIVASDGKIYDEAGISVETKFDEVEDLPSLIELLAS